MLRSMSCIFVIHLVYALDRFSLVITHLSSSPEVPSLMSSQNWFPLVIYQGSTLRCTRPLTHFVPIYGTGQGIINDSRVLKLMIR